MAQLRLAALLLLATASTTLAAQDPLATLPHNYWKVFDNADLTVIRAHYGAHEKIPTHDHAGFATVFIYLDNSSPVRIDHTEAGHTESIVRPPTVAGSFRIIPGMAERHSIENLGDQPSNFLRVELKHLTLALPAAGFRGKAPASVDRNQHAVEFSDPSGLQVERILCAGSTPCDLADSARPSLLVALAPETISAANAAMKQLAPGDVFWLPAGEPATVQAASSAPRQVLRLSLPQQ